MSNTFKDSYGTQYQSVRLAKYAKTRNGKPFNDGFTVRRISDRPVDIKRAARRAKKGGAL